MLLHLMHLPFSTGFWAVFALCAILALVCQVRIHRTSLPPSLALSKTLPLAASELRPYHSLRAERSHSSSIKDVKDRGIVV